LKENTLRDASERLEQAKADLKEEMSLQGWTYFIKPLRIIQCDNNMLTLFNINADHWLLRHYGKKIKDAINKGLDGEDIITIEITSEVK